MHITFFRLDCLFSLDKSDDFLLQFVSQIQHKFRMKVDRRTKCVEFSKFSTLFFIRFPLPLTPPPFSLTQTLSFTKIRFIALFRHEFLRIHSAGRVSYYYHHRHVWHYSVLLFGREVVDNGVQKAFNCRRQLNNIQACALVLVTIFVFAHTKYCSRLVMLVLLLLPLPFVIVGVM